MKVYLFLGRVMRADRGGQFTMVGRVLGFLHDLNGRVVSCDGVFSWHLAEKKIEYTGVTPTCLLFDFYPTHFPLQSSHHGPSSSSIGLYY
jgi:hypothetical protein